MRVEGSGLRVEGLGFRVSRLMLGFAIRYMLLTPLDRVGFGWVVICECCSFCVCLTSPEFAFFSFKGLYGVPHSHIPDLEVVSVAVGFYDEADKRGGV